MNSWPKIVVRCKDDKELRQLADTAQTKNINYYLMSKKVTLLKKKSKVLKNE